MIKDQMKKEIFISKENRIKKLKKEVIKLAAIKFLLPVGVMILLLVLIPKVKSEV